MTRAPLTDAQADQIIEGLHSAVDMDVEDVLGREVTLEESRLIGIAVRATVKRMLTAGKAGI